MTTLGTILVWASVAMFTFGALAFCTLSLFYWRQRRQRPGAGRAFPAFTAVCGAAFLLNLAQQAAPGLEWLSPLLDLVTGLVPALLVHLVASEECSGARWLLGTAYTGAVALAVAVAAGDAGWTPASWSDRLDSAPAAALLVAAVFALFLQVKSRRALGGAERRYRRWMRAILILLALNAGATGWPASPVFTLIPDYLLLALFCVTLYYKERLVFFDVVLKRGAFFAAGLLAFSLFFAYARPSLLEMALFAALWLCAPWIYAGLAGVIDRRWLRRRFSAAEAERRFVTAVQSAEGEQDLATRAAAALEEIFEARAGIHFDAVAAPPAEIAAEIGPRGWVTLAPRANGIPYLSGDRHLLQSLARTLGVVLDNVRFREREQQLRMLAGRAELKALRAQINPHFLFNALNAIAGLIPSNARAAEDTVEQLAEIFRYTLRKSGNEWVRLDEEIEFVTAYLRVEQARFGERLAVEIAVDPAAGGVTIPAMSVQPLVENAIKHGTSNVEGQGRVSVRAVLDGEVLTIEVCDNGPGFPPAPRPPASGASSGHGLRNIADRLSGYYGSSAELVCANGAAGARVTLRIPRERIAP